MQTGQTSTYVSGATSYAAFGGLTQMTVGALAETRAYNSRLQLTSLTAGTGATPPLTLSFGYPGTQNNGNLSSQTINHAGTVFTQNYTGYDGANRLTAASEGAGQ